MVEPGEPLQRRPLRARRRRGGSSEIRRPRAASRSSSAGRGSTCARWPRGCFAEPPLDPARRRSLDAWTARLEPLELLRWAGRLDPGFRGGGRQRAARAIEVALLTGRPLTYWQQAARAVGAIDPWYVVLTVPRPVLHQRIARRAEEMVRRGLIEEVAAVLAEGHAAARAPGLDGIGIREAVDYLHGPPRRARACAEAIATSTRQYAKRQETWFRHQLDGRGAHARRDRAGRRRLRRSEIAAASGTQEIAMP